MTDNEMIAALIARAAVASSAGQLELDSRLRAAARAIDTHNRNAELRAIANEHDADDYESWMRCGARLKATGYSQALNAWRSWSKTSPKCGHGDIYETWASFPKPPEQQT